MVESQQNIQTNLRAIVLTSISQAIMEQVYDQKQIGVLQEILSMLDTTFVSGFYQKSTIDRLVKWIQSSNHSTYILDFLAKIYINIAQAGIDPIEVENAYRGTMDILNKSITPFSRDFAIALSNTGDPQYDKNSMPYYTMLFVLRVNFSYTQNRLNILLKEGKKVGKR